MIYQKCQPLIVDTGISTYEKNKRRNIERSTASHNTVMIGGKEQSEMWGGFRVGKRANIISLEEKENFIRAVHDGYQTINCSHQRAFISTEKTFRIEDKITGDKEGIAFLHFAPHIVFELKNNTIEGSDWRIEFSGFDEITCSDYLFAEGFNQTKSAQKVSITFYNNLITNLIFL